MVSFHIHHLCHRLLTVCPGITRQAGYQKVYLARCSSASSATARAPSLLPASSVVVADAPAPAAVSASDSRCRAASSSACRASFSACTHFHCDQDDATAWSTSICSMASGHAAHNRRRCHLTTAHPASPLASWHWQICDIRHAAENCMIADQNLPMPPFHHVESCVHTRRSAAPTPKLCSQLCQPQVGTHSLFKEGLHLETALDSSAVCRQTSPETDTLRCASR